MATMGTVRRIVKSARFIARVGITSCLLAFEAGLQARKPESLLGAKHGWETVSSKGVCFSPAKLPAFGV